MGKWLCGVIIVFICIRNVNLLNNGVLLTPPMGWLAWERFKCNTDCINHPNNCISENLFMEMADRLVEDGFLRAGYNRINIDDCWMSRSRDDNYKLQADPFRFSEGIHHLANYVHEKGLKLGIYGDYGLKTCMGYPGIWNDLQSDANTFAEWQVDMLKLDGCHSRLEKMDTGYPEMEKCLNRTGRKIAFSCSWPYYQTIENIEPNYQLIAKHCNLWRNYHDITDSWESIKAVIDFYAFNQEVLVPLAGPGHWNDPDMIVIGNDGLTYDQSKVQMGMWALLAAPLLMSNDLRSLKPELRDILLNKDIIAINQDHFGIQGKRIFEDRRKGIEIWARPIGPKYKDRYSFAIGILNANLDESVKKVTLMLKQIGLTFEEGYIVYDVFGQRNLGVLHPASSISVFVKQTDIVVIRALLNIDQ